MKQSQMRRVELKPLEEQDFSPKSKKKTVEQERYIERIENEQSNKRIGILGMFDWSKPSQVIDTRKVGSPLKRNDSMNTQELLRSSESERGSKNSSSSPQNVDDSRGILINSRHLRPKISYYQFVRQYGDENTMTIPQLEKQLKEMREKIVEMNKMLNEKLDKYELLVGNGSQQQRQVNIHNPYKFLGNQIEVNEKIIHKQQSEIKSIHEKQKQLQKKDYLFQLQELIIQIQKMIHDSLKEKHERKVIVDKLDKNILEIQENIDGDDFRQIKQLRTQLVFYFKKLKEQKITQESLDAQILNMKEKQAKISKRFDDLARLAVQKCLEVTSNSHYLQLKKKYEDLVSQIDGQRKKKALLVKTQQNSQEKLEKDIQQFKKQIDLIEKYQQQFEQKSTELEYLTEDLISSSNLSKKLIKPIAYRFHESLMGKQNSDQISSKLKPDFKRVYSRLDSSHRNNETISYDTINDKNMEPNAERIWKKQALKPMLKGVKGKTVDNNRYVSNESNFKTIDSSNIFKPSLLLKNKK